MAKMDKWKSSFGGKMKIAEQEVDIDLGELQEECPASTYTQEAEDKLDEVRHWKAPWGTVAEIVLEMERYSVFLYKGLNRP